MHNRIRHMQTGAEPRRNRGKRVELAYMESKATQIRRRTGADSGRQMQSDDMKSRFRQTDEEKHSQASRCRQSFRQTDAGRAHSCLQLRI